MTDFYVQEAFEYYDKHINRQERFKLLKEHKFSITGSIPSIDWELFGSILTGDIGKSGYGSDLSHYEIKSATGTGSFEYQYHLHGGLTKLKEDMIVDHLFISYSADYANVIVRLVAGTILEPIFQSWEESLIANYTGANRKQRFRRSIAYGTIIRLGSIITYDSGIFIQSSQAIFCNHFPHFRSKIHHEMSMFPHFKRVVTTKCKAFFKNCQSEWQIVSPRWHILNFICQMPES